MTENLLATHICVPRTQNVPEVGAQLKPVIQHLGGTHRRSVSGNRDPSCPLCSLPDSKTLYRERLQALLLPHHILPRTIVLSGTIEMSFVTFGDFCNIHLSQKYKKKKKQTKQQETYCFLAGAHQLTSDPCHNYPPLPDSWFLTSNHKRMSLPGPGGLEFSFQTPWCCLLIY